MEHIMRTLRTPSYGAGPVADGTTVLERAVV